MRPSKFIENAEAEITALRAALAEKDREIAFLMANDRTIAAAMDELRAALDQERADNERLRAFAQDCEDTLGSDDEIQMLLNEHGLTDMDGVPTALLSGRGEREGNG